MGDGIPGVFVVFFVLVVVLGIGSTIWRVSAARRIARSSGLDPDDATAVTLLDHDGLAATYLGAGLAHGGTAAPQTTEERLAELDRLRAAGTISDAEYAATRQRILDAL
jgi:Short C-terminal domain